MEPDFGDSEKGKNLNGLLTKHDILRMLESEDYRNMETVLPFCDLCMIERLMPLVVDD